MKRAGIGVAIAYLLVAVVSIAWPARSSTDDNRRRVASRARHPDAVGVHAVHGGCRPHPARLGSAADGLDRPLRVGGAVGALHGTASILSPPDSPVTLVADVRPGARVLAWGDWGFLLAEPGADGDSVVVRVLGPSGSPLAEPQIDR